MTGVIPGRMLSRNRGVDGGVCDALRLFSGSAESASVACQRLLKLSERIVLQDGKTPSMPACFNGDATATFLQVASRAVTSGIQA